MDTSLDHAHPHSLSLFYSHGVSRQLIWRRAGVCWPCEG